MVINEPSGSPSENLLAAGTLDDIAGQATRKCESCGVAEVPVGPCFVRDQALSGFSNPNTRICLYAARRPLNADIYPPFDQSTRHALEAQLEFVPRSEDENHKTRFANTIEKIELKAEHVVAVSNAFEENQVVVLKAPTGFGKSTKLPYWLCWHEDSKFSYNSGKVIVTEPKRLAAEGVAGTVSMAHQYQPPAPGLDVGLQHGGVSSSGESNKLIFVTDGSLINRLIKRELDDVQLIIVDEAHERNERIELILLILRFLLPQYPHLKLLILSATIDPQNFTTYFQPKDESGSGDSRSEAPFISVRACEIEWKPEQAKFEVQEVWSREGFKPKFDAAGLKKIAGDGKTVSCALLWLARALNFIIKMLEELIANPGKKLSDCVLAGYEVSLKPHHGMMIRTTFSVGVKAAPYRDAFVAKLGPSEEEVFGAIKGKQADMSELVKSVQGYLKTKDPTIFAD